MIEPLAVGFYAAMQGRARVGQTAIVMGAGCIGLVTMMALKAMGVSKVYVVEKVKKLTDTRGCDLAVETAGTQVTTVQTIHMTKKGAAIILVGYSKRGEMTLPMGLVLDKELTFKTIFRYRHIYPIAIDVVAAGKVNLKGIVTDVFGLDEVQKAMDYSINNKEDIVNSVICIAE